MPTAVFLTKCARKAPFLQFTDELEFKGIAGDITGRIIDIAQELLTDPIFLYSVYASISSGSNGALRPAYGKGGPVADNGAWGFADDAAGGAGKGLKINDKQFGKKVGKHAEDFGFDPSISESRDFIRSKVNTIFNKPVEIREGFFRGQGDMLPNGGNAWKGHVLHSRKRCCPYRYEWQFYHYFKGRHK